MKNSKEVFQMFRPGFPHHVCTKGKDGHIIFYSTADTVFYYTLYSCKSRKYHIRVTGFSIMPNHVHSQEKAASESVLVSFHSETESCFVKSYNVQHHRTGRLFKKPFEYAPKTAGKKIRENIVYIGNNAVVGGIVENAVDYRWNMLAYNDNKWPFSDKMWLKSSSARMRRAVKMTCYYREHEMPLDYTRQKMIFKGLQEKELMQLLDYIVYSYNFLDYNEMSSYFNGGSFDAALQVMKSNSGSENDIPDDYDDYSAYEKMGIIIKAAGYDVRNCNFETLTIGERKRLIDLLYSSGFTARQIRKYLHIPPPSASSRKSTPNESMHNTTHIPDVKIAVEDNSL